MNLKQKILIPTLGLIAFSTMTISLLTYRSTRSSMVEATKSEMRQMARSLVTQLDAWLEDRTAGVENWSAQKVFVTATQDSFIGQAARKSAYADAVRLVRQNAFIESLGVAATNGSVVVSSDSETVQDLRVSDQRCFQEALLGKRSVSGVIASKTNGQPVFVVSSPIRENDQVVGVLIATVNLERFSNKFLDPLTIHKQGYVFLCDSNGIIVAHPDKQQLLRLDISVHDWGRAILHGINDIVQYSFEGTEKLVAREKSAVTGWCIGVTAPMQELLANARRAGLINLGFGGVTLAGAMIALLFILRRAVNPLTEAIGKVQQVAARDLTVRLEQRSQDEVGVMIAALDRMVQGLNQNMHLIARNARSLSTASRELTTTSSQVSTDAGETAQQANAVAAGAEQVSKNVATVATASEEMNASIREIAQQASRAAQVAGGAAEMAAEINATMSKLGQSSTEIGQVIKVITSIAEQTNLLALNATIEAARAGDAGRGFAVVANEVKELARQTAQATADISTRIAAIQTDTQGAMTAIQRILQTVEQINQIQTVIASSVEEQAATMNDITRNSVEASSGSSEIARNVASVSQAASSSTAAASKTSSAAQELERLAAGLQTVVSSFRLSDPALDGAPPAPAAPFETGRRIGSDLELPHALTAVSKR